MFSMRVCWCQLAPQNRTSNTSVSHKQETCLSSLSKGPDTNVSCPGFTQTPVHPDTGSPRHRLPISSQLRSLSTDHPVLKTHIFPPNKPDKTNHSTNSKTNKMKQSARIVLLCIFLVIILMSQSLMDMGEALFLTKNSFKELKDQYFGITQEPLKTQGLISDITDIDYPLNNMVNSIFPIDAKLQINNTNLFFELMARYASFSPILNAPVLAHYTIFPTDACEAMDFSPEFEGKVIVVLRGTCTFVNKVENLIPLRPKVIVIANDEPTRGLITMYSSTFNEDRSLRVPIMFTTRESYDILKHHQLENMKMTVSTVSLGNWLNIILSMMLSPPLLILLIYCIIQLGQHFRKVQQNRVSLRIVGKLPVYIFSTNHLVHHKDFYNYLVETRQTEAFNELQVSSSSSSSSSASLPHVQHTPSTTDMTTVKINGVSLMKVSQKYNILIANRDFFPSYKCSICLDSFKCLKSRVLVLDCKHFFHEKCLSNWLINFKRSCPLCNKSVLGGMVAGQSSYGSFEENVGVRILDGVLSIESDDSLDDLNIEAESTQIESASLVSIRDASLDAHTGIIEADGGSRGSGGNPENGGNAENGGNSSPVSPDDVQAGASSRIYGHIGGTSSTQHNATEPTTPPMPTETTPQTPITQPPPSTLSTSTSSFLTTNTHFSPSIQTIIPPTITSVDSDTDSVDTIHAT